VTASPRSTLPPFPAGWYGLCHGSELPAGAVLPRTVCGRELAVFRTAAGQAIAVDAYCPHLGAHMGHTGSVEGETLRCAFHGFRFDTSGACVATGYGTRPPPRCAVTRWPVHEVNGWVLVHHDPTGRPPSWHIPSDPEEPGWTRTRSKTFLLPGHVQDLAENSVDIGHLGLVHGYREIETLAELEAEGPLLRARYAFRHPRGVMGLGKNARAEIDIRVHGLGYSQVEVTLAELGFRSRQFVLAAPAAEGQVELRVGMCMKRAPGARGAIGWIASLLPSPLFDAFVARAAFDTFVDDVADDVPIWSTKRYADPPRLAEGDGPIGRYRRWARQFYALAAPATSDAAP
jgi:nitrite reductase/ring-hydroxylating ferredoxin subunit